jgi:hypothetical protein
MRWLPRLFWLSAWALWLWLGVGLHRELPRDWGPAVRKLPMDFVGFVHDSDIALCNVPLRFEEYQCVDVRTGAKLYEPIKITADGESGVLSLRHGFAVGLCFDASIKEFESASLHSFNLRTGEWKNLHVKPNRIFDVHRIQPWIAVRLENGERNEPRVAVVDVLAGSTLGVWGAEPAPNNAPVDFVQDCWFTGDGDEIVVRISGESLRGKDQIRVEQRLEHWSVSIGPVGEPVPLKRVYGRSTKAAGGRIVASNFGGTVGSFEVLDHRTGASLLDGDFPGLHADGQRRTYPLEACLSPSGHNLLPKSNSLWNIDDRRPIWKGRAQYEEIVAAHPQSSRIGVLEEWTEAAARIGSKSQHWTFAIRDLETGAVVHRVWGTGPISQDFSPSVRYALLKREGADPDDPQPEHVVVDATPNVNWTLLVICQTILALPILMVWAVLKWRRRAAKRQPVEAAT